MIKTKVYQYDSSKEFDGYRGTDYSKYVLQGVQITEDITQELDTAELTLCGLKTSKEFEPESKFIIDVWEQNQIGEDVLRETHHFCVARDVVSQPILSDNNYFDHHISFIEPSVVAQKRLVDNIAVTYKLKDVELVERPAFPNTTSSLIFHDIIPSPSKNFGIIYDRSGILTQKASIDASCGKYFSTYGALKIINRNGDETSATYNNIENFASDGGYYAKFRLPRVGIFFGIYGTTDYQLIGDASISYLIKEVSFNDETSYSVVASGNIISNSDLGYATVNEDFGWRDKINGEWLLEQSVVTNTISLPGNYQERYTNYYRKYTKIGAPIPSYITNEIELKPNKKYIIEISLYQFPDNPPSGFSKFTGQQPSYYTNLVSNSTLYLSGDFYWYASPSNKYLSSTGTSASSFYVTYDIDVGTIIYTNSTPYSALSLLQKAIINSSIYEKKDGEYIGNINQSDLPFYIDENFVDQLSSTTIVENFYSQKNLWEIMLEVGNYIHSIPEIKFGDNDKFVITFNPLGRTDEKPDNSTKVSIFNSRSVEDYISATSSYITNMVQLGGVIEEWVVPKTTNDQLIISNDTAEIITSKPIIELIEIIAKNNITGQTQPITEYIYEENVYKTLQLDYRVEPNRGIAMYYKLGTNIITGGQYQLPQANTNIYTDYAFKKILWSAFNGYPVLATPPALDVENYWRDLKVSDYSFFIKYRTKDSVRQNHIRPDIRKYLVNSKFDRFPEHNQFNNQTDVVIDSIKFGNNMYGKLIKTGNSNYEKTEWNDQYGAIKHKGELYRISGDLFYVAKITHYYFSSYILSKTTYSKDYNELSKVVGIPSEPRFYEISEQSLIWRELAINDILLLTDDKDNIEYKSNYVFDFNHLSKLVIGEETDFAKYALTVFKGDKDIQSYNQSGGQPNYYKEVLNAVNAYSSENTLTYEWDMADNYSAGDKSVSLEPNDDLEIDERAYSSLKAVPYTDIYGKVALFDFYILENVNNLSSDQIKNLPESPIKTKYENIVGEFQGQALPTNSELSDFVLEAAQREVQDFDLVKFVLTTNNKEYNYIYSEGTWGLFVGDFDILGTNVKEYDTNFNGRGIGLLKDCREALSINFNLQLATSSDTFVISPFVFSPNKQNVRVVLLANEVNKLSSGYIDNSEIITPLDINGNTMGQYFNFEIERDIEPSSWGDDRDIFKNFGINLRTLFSQVNENHFNGNEDYQQVKSIAILYNIQKSSLEGNENYADEPVEDLMGDTSIIIPTKTQFIIAKNIPSFWDKENATKPIYFGSPKYDQLFSNKQ